MKEIGADAERAIAELVAREQIRELPGRYAAALEVRDVDAMAALFAEHARFGRYGSGPDALRRLTIDSLAHSVFITILVANHLIEFDGPDQARGEVWAQCFAQTESEGFVEQLIKYRDIYVRVGDRWRFLRRRHHLWYGVRREPSPLRQRDAEWPRRQVGVGDLPLADQVFVNWWRTGL